MNDNEQIRRFVNDLARHSPETRVANPYLDVRARHNLSLFLAYSLCMHPRILMVGEAPGYRGCMLTGIPFTSPRTILESAAPFFRDCREQLALAGPTSEASARAVWEVLEESDSHVLLWNVFPFHPHKEGTPQSNRRPTSPEIDLGMKYLKRLNALFDPITVLAVGRTSERVVGKLQPTRRPQYIRHPSYGGKAQFRSGFLASLRSDDS